MKKNLKKFMATVLCTAIFLSAISFVSAAIEKKYMYDGDVGDLDGGYAYKDKDQYKDAIATSLIKIHEYTNGVKGGLVNTYCADASAELKKDIYYKLQELDNTKVRAILRASYPAKSEDAVIGAVNNYAGMTSSAAISIKSDEMRKRIITATQFAIWHYTNGFVPVLNASKEVEAYINRIYQYLVNLPGADSTFSRATIPALEYKNTLLADRSYEVIVEYPEKASGLNSDGSDILLSYNLDNSKKWNVVESDIKKSGIAYKKVVITVPEASFENDMIRFNFTVKGIQTQYEEFRFICDDLEKRNQDLVGYTSKEYDIEAVTQIALSKPALPAAPTPTPTIEPVPYEHNSSSSYFSLTTAVEGKGTITPASGSAAYTKGTSVVIIATPAEGWVFDHWEGDIPVNKQIEMTSNKYVKAVFVQEAVITPEAAPAASIAIPTPTLSASTELATSPVPVQEERIPAGPAKLPKTGGIPVGLFYGFGGLITAAGVLIRMKKK